MELDNKYIEPCAEASSLEKTEYYRRVDSDIQSAILKQLVILNAPDKQAQREWYYLNSWILDTDWEVNRLEEIIFPQRGKSFTEEQTQVAQKRYNEISSFNNKTRERMDLLVQNKGVTSMVGMFEGIPTSVYDNCALRYLSDEGGVKDEIN